MKDTPFCSLPSDQKVSAMAVLALAVYRTQACRKALVARKSAEESWAKEEKKKQKQARKDADQAKAQLKKEALEKIKKERAERYDLGVPSCGGAFTPSTRLVSRNDGSGWFLFRF